MKNLMEELVRLDHPLINKVTADSLKGLMTPGVVLDDLDVMFALLSNYFHINGFQSAANDLTKLSLWAYNNPEKAAVIFIESGLDKEDE